MHIIPQRVVLTMYTMRCTLYTVHYTLYMTDNHTSTQPLTIVMAIGSSLL